jgi:hypothetical protein
MEILTGKQLIDTYCKRSNTLMEKVSTLMTLKLIHTLTLHTVGHGIRKVDGRVRGNLYGKVGDHSRPSLHMLNSKHTFTDPRALGKEGTVSTCRTISGRGTVLL